jgi:hypothetical protein
MDEKTKKFLQDNFKEGEYCKLTLLVNIKDLKTLLDGLKAININMAAIPQYNMTADFDDDDNGSAVN